MKNINVVYVICLIDIHERTQRDIDIEFASYKARFPERTKEDYVNYLKNWDSEKYSYEIDPQGYFIDRQKAIEATRLNIADINESGSFPYVVIATKTLNHMYPDCMTEEPLLFKFNKDNEMYEDVEWPDTEMFKILNRKICAGGF